ncbi:MAG: valine--tRNA ligase [Fimbriimonas ginsengisoli]|uniref:Valine--tRNA ligase n=1 Tax=Fimbriimonas ginsengisoli TaxID=1005039 RepID=A0A931LST1_FIMGI|nr:valine--tRNA ligase [Fimbriimonas ginsengisoli]
MSDTTLPTRYDASATESKWYARWEEAGLFGPDRDPSKERYTITIPPPNITGSLHMGHALCYPLQDLFGRYHRLLGKSVLVLPGQDHAGIATQSVVEKVLRKEGTSGSAIGRDKFVERVWEWRRESGNTILRQLRSLGCAFDWSRSRFTLDEAYVDAVYKVFIEWFERGLIYRGKRVVNWDPVLRTSVSDIETERRTIRGKLTYIRYPFADGSGHVTIATTRPETMLADVAVAVHPSDKRYAGLVGKTIRLPLLGREIPLIADIYPDPGFGSGAVKITPAHDANDYDVGVRHGLPMPVLLDEAGRITAEGGPYAGLDRIEARKRVVADLEALGVIEKIEDYDIPILVSERSGEPIEPLLSEQWFVRQTELAKAAIKAVESGQVRFAPERYAKIFIAWCESIRDWCVSRQLWWGHRIPVYYDAEGIAYAALSKEEAQAKAGAKPIVRQEEDVLDTWFSSGLWPFATLGWPEKTADLRERYPTSVLITDRNILYLWVGRMMMMGLDFLGEKPFSDVMIFATVLNEQGRRMSKSLGTGVDPMSIIDNLGADILRYTLLSQTGTNQDIRYSERRTEDARNFANKIWNATRFVLMNAPEGDLGPPAPGDLELVDRWLLSRLTATERAVREAYDGYDIQSACQALFQFFWSELCDWYIEVTKHRLTDPARRAVPQWALLTALDAFVKMLHPVMPHLTEEIYSHLPVPDKAPFLMSARWPTPDPGRANPAAEAEFERAREITRALRELRAEIGLAAMRTIPCAYVEGDLGAAAAIVASQAWVSELRQGRPEGAFLSASCAGLDLHLPVEGLVDVEKERARLAREAERLTEELQKLRERLASPMFVDRAKPEVVQREREAAAEAESRLAKVLERQKVFE